jgi:hypothetical protein
MSKSVKLKNMQVSFAVLVYVYASAGRSSFDIVAAMNCRMLGLMYSVPVTSLGVLARATGDHLERAAQHVHQLEDSLLSTVEILRDYILVQILFHGW